MFMIFAPMVVNLLALKVNVLDHASIVNMGPNQFIDQFISYKRNQGFGEQNGDVSPVNIPISWIADPDLNDSNSVKNSVI
jgi:hypothetical protein